MTMDGPQAVLTWTGEVDVLATARAIDQWKIDHAVQQYDTRRHDERHREQAIADKRRETQRKVALQWAEKRRDERLKHEARARRVAEAERRSVRRAERRAYAQPMYGGHDDDRYREPPRYHTERHVELDEVLGACRQLKQLRARPSEVLHVFGTHNLRDTLNEARRRYG
jgi:hypothetical protein